MSQPPEYSVRFENLCKVYEMGDQQVHALAGVSAGFEKGSFWAIMGASGSGKSTMLNILGCLDRPTSGSYYLDGRDVSALDDDALSDIRLKYIGFIFQSFNLIPQLTVAENIELPLYYQGADSAASRSMNAGKGMLPRSSPDRVRTATVPWFASRSPTTSSHGTFCKVCSRIL